MSRKHLQQRRSGRQQTQLEAMLQKAIQGASRLAPRGKPLEQLRLLVVLSEQLDRAIMAGMQQARAEGHSWGEIAGPLRISPQAAQQRVAHLVRPPVG